MKHYGIPLLDLRKARSQKKISNLSQDRHLPGYSTMEISIRPESTVAIGKTFFTINNTIKFANLTG